jgi:hypothetical protein
MIDLQQDYYLKEMPFSVVPDSTRDIIWAGMQQTKELFEREIRASLISRSTKILINYGSYGSGKTHSALYYSSNEHFDFVGNKNIKSFLLKFPKNSKNPTEDIFQSFIGKYGIRKLIEDLKEIRISIDDFESFLEGYNDDEEIRNVIIKILEFESLDDTKRVLYNKATTTFLNNNGIFKKVDNDNVIEVFSIIIKLLTYQKNDLLIFWIDEFEDITTLNRQNANKMTSFIRDLIDNIPQKLLIFLNFVPTAFVDLESLYSYFIGSSLERRVQKGVEFQAFSKEDMKEYVKDALRIYRENTFTDENLFFPFSESLLDEIYREVSSELTVGKLNKILSEILENAILDSQQEINLEYYNSIKNKLYSIL